jgi:hypothetical protein
MTKMIWRIFIASTRGPNPEISGRDRSGLRTAEREPAR